MSTFKTNPWDIDQLLSLMDSRKIVLPEFQRSFVWWPSDIDLLITSLVQDYPGRKPALPACGRDERPRLARGRRRDTTTAMSFPTTSYSTGSSV